LEALSPVADTFGGNGEANAVTAPGTMSVKKPTIILADTADPAPGISTLAHELGHAFDLPDITETSANVSGTINNLTGVILDPPPNTTTTARRRLLMFIPPPNTDSLITSDQVDMLRLTLEIARSKNWLSVGRE
jgi:hypothetical protein